MSSFFSSYIQSVTAICLCTFVFQWIAQSGYGNTKKALGFISSLCIFVSVVFPFLGGLESFKNSVSKNIFQNNFAVDESFGYDSFIELTKNNAENSIKTEILNKTGINVTDISIALQIEEDEIHIEEISVTVPSESADSIETIAEIVYGLSGVSPSIMQD